MTFIKIFGNKKSWLTVLKLIIISNHNEDFIFNKTKYRPKLSKAYEINNFVKL